MPPPPPAPAEPKQPKHGGISFGVVWVNDVGREAMASDKPKFPVGSIIVREKFLRKEDTQPELLAAMIKRAAGFSKASNDWEYVLLDSEAKKIQQVQKKGACNDCHSQQRDRDFVFPLIEVK